VGLPRVEPTKNYIPVSRIIRPGCEIKLKKSSLRFLLAMNYENPFLDMGPGFPVISIVVKTIFAVYEVKVFAENIDHDARVT
jgi:hypothetical protein